MNSSDFVPLRARRGKDPKKEARIAEEKRAMAKALVAAGRPYREVAEALGISVGSVHNIMKESREDIMRILKETRARHAMKCFMLSDHILGRISDSDIINASLKDKVIASAILADKAVKFKEKAAPEGPATDDGKAGEPSGRDAQSTPADRDRPLNAFEQPGPKNDLKTAGCNFQLEQKNTKKRQGKRPPVPLGGGVP